MGGRGGDGAPASRRGRFVGPLLAAHALVIGLTASLLAAGALLSVQRDNAGRVLDQRTGFARTAVTAQTERYRALLAAVAAGIAADDRPTATDFAALTAPFAAGDLLGVTSVAYVVPAAPGDVAATQADWRDRGADGLVLTPHPGAAEHRFAVLGRALDPGGPSPAGLDVAAAAEASAALDAARRTGRGTVSDTYVLLRDRGLPPDRRPLSFAFVAPVTAGGAFRGWVVLGLHGQDFLGGVLRAASQGQLDGELLAADGAGRRVRVAAYRGRGTPELRREVTVTVADKRWTLVTRADPRYLPGARTDLPAVVLLGGLAVTVTLAALVYVLATSRSRAQARVRAATGELRAAEEQARAQAALLAAIMNSMGDGVGVVDDSGAFLLHNPAARELLGIDDDVDGPQDWQAHYGLFTPDGRTPFPLAAMPLMRALSGESTDGVEMLIRNRAHPDGILVSVAGRPLDASAGRTGAVAVFRDITELRRYEAELTAFAGVVAHDLKSPLAVIRGYCEAGTEELADAPPGPAVDATRDLLERTAAATDRMAGLIDTLLAYTTARDARLRRTRVPLDALVAQVVAERTGHWRPADGPPPDVYVGPLPAVDADPAMLRHVVDNLVGNALKYVPRGTRARVDVTAGTTPAGLVRLEVADRGIGIPDADKPHVFDTFHRAASAAGYAGTGLGLAICKRIVERHGGTVAVSDNPGGGSRFHVELPPAADRPAVTPGPPEPAAAPAAPAEAGTAPPGPDAVPAGLRPAAPAPAGPR